MDEAGLSYGNIKLGELVGKDTDLDGVLDWEEGLWGTDPTKKDTNADGVDDGAEIAKLKAEREASGEDQLLGKTSQSGEETLTQTGKFSRELFSAVATLNQAGEVDQATADKLTSSLANQIKNATPRKVFLLSEIKIIPDNSTATAQKYITQIADIYKKHPAGESVIDILGEFVNDGENINVEALKKLDGAIEQTSLVLGELVKMNVPSEIAPLHLDLLNILEILMENLIDIQLFETDPVVAMGAFSKYEENTITLDNTLQKLGNAIKERLNN
ncbi:MAG: hypothetical protein Q8O46_01410 [bacterium]|nr:hypothetical protein [bacterium]